MKKNAAPGPVVDSGFWTVMLVLALILVLALAGYVAYQRWGGGSGAALGPAPTADVVSENGELYGGLPQAASDDAQYEVLRNSAYVVGSSEKRRDPLWVAYHLKATSNHSAPPRPRGFLPDGRTAAHIESRDYAQSGYDRGHMCPNHAIGAHFGAAAQEETFLMSNVIPQKHELNAGIWEELEHQESDVYPNDYGEVWVIDGPVFHEPARTLDRSGVAIPDACYKIIVRLETGHPHVMPVVMPQNVGHDRAIGRYLTRVRQIEDQIHLRFFTALKPEERARVEEEQPAAPW